MQFQTFRPIDGVLSRFGRRTESLHAAIERAKEFKNSEVREFGTLRVVWVASTLLGIEQLYVPLKPKPVKVAPLPRAVHPAPAVQASACHVTRTYPRGRK